MNFEIGDRVISLVNHPDGNTRIVVGSKGTVCNIHKQMGRGLGVCWDRNVGGHNCDTFDCESGHGWWVSDEDVELLEEGINEIDEVKFIEIICGTKTS